MFPLQVKSIFSQIRTFPSLIRNVTTKRDTGTNGSLYRLEQRALLRVCSAGDAAERYETTGFLQVLLTNDMRHIKEGSPCIYSMFLNTKGRVMFDTLVHATEEQDNFLLECDVQAVTDLKKHLKMYRLKRKVEIHDFNEYNLFSFIGQPGELPDSKIKLHKDPRMHNLGYRVLAPPDVSTSDLCKTLGENVILEKPHEYRYMRYQLGVSEGVQDLPPGACIPLEANCDYLHGVSFHKGCYIGQELVARVHHTGVVRKRFMPLKFYNAPNEPIERDSPITNIENPKTKIGKLKGVQKDYGLALVNISDALQAKSLEVAGYKGTVERPGWWPIEASKEKASTAKTKA